MSEPSQSALVVAVPAAEAAVGSHRERFDISAEWGVPPHITVLYPFVHPTQINEAVLGSIAKAVGAVPRFHAQWRKTAWFDDDVLWLAPEPAAPFRALTTAVFQAFPDSPPYGGQYEGLAPHLTVGSRGTPDQLRAIERDVLTHLPISMDVTHVQVMCGAHRAGSWRKISDIALG
jgi:hypothetical protein